MTNIGWWEPDLVFSSAPGPRQLHPGHQWYRCTRCGMFVDEGYRAHVCCPVCKQELAQWEDRCCGTWRSVPHKIRLCDAPAQPPGEAQEKDPPRMKQGTQRIRKRSATAVRLTKVERRLILAEAQWRAEHLAWPEDRAAWARIFSKLKRTFVAQRSRSRK